MFEIPTSQDPLEELFNDDKFWLHQKYLNIFPRNVPFCGTWKIWVQFATKLYITNFTKSYVSWSALRIFWKQQIDKSNANVSQFSWKSSLCTNGKVIDFEMTLRGEGFSPVRAMGNFAGEGGGCWVVGIWQRVFLTIWIFFKLKTTFCT